MREQRPDLAGSIQGSSGGGVFVDSLGGKQGGGGGVGKLEKGGWCEHWSRQLRGGILY